MAASTGLVLMAVGILIAGIGVFCITAAVRIWLLVLG